MAAPSAPPMNEANQYHRGVDGHHFDPPQSAQHPSQIFIIRSAVLTRYSTRVTCQNCLENVKTVTEEKPRMLAHVLCATMVLFGCWFCCCIPYCLDSLHEVEHSCPRCQALIGTYIIQ